MKLRTIASHTQYKDVLKRSHKKLKTKMRIMITFHVVMTFNFTMTFHFFVAFYFVGTLNLVKKLHLWFMLMLKLH